MKRLTIRNSDGTVSQPINLKWEEALEKLASYEDVGLTPKEVQDLKVAWDMYGGEYGITELLLAKDGWVSSRDDLPKKSGCFLVVIHPMDSETLQGFDIPETRFVTEMFYDEPQKLWKGTDAEDCYNADLNVVDKTRTYYVTHWAPRPKLPPE